MIAIKEYAKKRKKIVRNYSANRICMQLSPATKFNQQTRKKFRFTTQNVRYPTKNEQEKSFLIWKDNSYKQKQDYYKKKQEDDSEFQDLILRRLNKIETNLLKLKKKKNQKIYESGSISEQQKTISQIENSQIFQQKYIPINKIGQYSPCKYNSHIDTKPFVDNSYYASSCQLSDNVFSYKAAKPQEYHSQRCHYHQFGYPVYFIPFQHRYQNNISFPKKNMQLNKQNCNFNQSTLTLDMINQNSKINPKRYVSNSTCIN